MFDSNDINNLLDKSTDENSSETKDILEPPEDIQFDDSTESGEEKNSVEPDSKTCNNDAVDETTIENDQDESDTSPPEWLSDCVLKIAAHYQTLHSLIKYTKTKDESINKLSNELQKYREDYCAHIFKPIAMLIIPFIEDCNKTLSDLEKYDYDVSKVKKYLGFLSDEYFELLSNAGITQCENEWLFNGSKVIETEETKTPLINPFKSLPSESTVVLQESVPNIRSADELGSFLKDSEEQIKSLLADNEARDKCLREYIYYSFNIEYDVVKLFVVPYIRILISAHQKLNDLIQQCTLDMTDDNCKEKYSECLNYIIKKLNDILYCGGVETDGELREDFDPKKDRVMKTITIDDERLDRRISKRHTKCYIMNGKVIYMSKVDVYKYAITIKEN